MLRWRMALGVTFSALTVLWFWCDTWIKPPGLMLLLLALLLTVLSTQELLDLISARGFRPAPWVIYSGNLAIVAANALPVWLFHQPQQAPGGLWGPTAIAFALAVLALFGSQMGRYRQPGESLEGLGGGLLAMVYVGLLFAFLAQMRWLPLGEQLGGLGLPALASLVLVVKLCDIGAYTAGRLLGKHKMTPILSPGKTVEGAIGGILFACVGAWCFCHLLLPAWIDGLAADQPRFGWLVLGLSVGLAGMAGDLAESLIKRDVGRKDSSRWMPGFGGVLDLLDSILFAAPIAYLVWSAGWVAR